MRRLGTAVATALLIWGLVLPAGSATAAVSSNPPATPQIGGSRTSGSDGTIEVARQITQCGNVMYVAGSFTQVRNPGSQTPITRRNAFAFSANPPYTINNWNPNVNGTVETVACGTDGSVFLGGAFSSAGGAANRNLAKVNATTGRSMAFAYHPAGRVAHVEVVQPRLGEVHLLVGGYFAGLLRSVNPVTGAADGYGTPTITGTYTEADFPAAPHARRVYNMSPWPAPYNPANPSGLQTRVLMTGVFDTVGGQHHEQVFWLDLPTGSSQVNPWAPRELFRHCFTRQPFYAQDAVFSPDGTTVYTATTGLRLHEEFAMNPRPTVRTGPCDATIAFPTTQGEFDGFTWINHTGCDSMFSVAADTATVYSGGHQRWQHAELVCTGRDSTDGGPGSVYQPGLSTINPADGLPQPGPDRGRGLGAADLLRTSAGLWIASDNQANTAMCAGRSDRMGICFLPN
jgi:hypothetical protein